MKVIDLLHDLEMEKQAHMNARLSLEEKTSEVEQHALRLAEQEQISNAKHQENVQLAERIQEMTRLADIQQERLQQALAAAASSATQGAEEELKKVQEIVEMKTQQLATIKERVRVTVRLPSGRCCF